MKDCELFELPQHLESGEANPDWLELRRGVLTATDFGPWLLKSTTQTEKKARENAICKLIAETARAWEEPVFVKEAMKRGLELEPEAVAAFEEATGKTVKPIGFARSIHGLFGCSPDGIIEEESSGLEGKVPLPSTHIKYRRAGELPPEYRFQVHGSMAVTGATSWWFQSYNPGLANFRIKVDRDEFTEELLECLKKFSKEVEIALSEEAKAWQDEFGSSQS